MSFYDWLVVVIPLIAVFTISVKTQRYIHGVSDFLAAGRSAGRFLVSIGDGMAGIGLITAIGAMEMFYQAGTAINWWGQIGAPVGLLIALSGFVIFRFRQTRAMTMAQFFEIRYSRRFRVFMGLLAWISGVINYGIFPAVAAHFFSYYCGLPLHFPLLGFNVSTFALLMFLFLSIALYMVLLGGQLQVMVSDCVQGLICGVLVLIVAFAILYLFSFEQMFRGMTDRPDGQSLLNPFNSQNVQDFNIWYVLIGTAGSIYTYMSWQGTQGVNASALNPHEAKMGKVIAGWRNFAQNLMFTLLGIAAVTYMRHPDFAAGAAGVTQTLAAIPEASVKTQMTVPIALSHILPVGVKGALAAFMLFHMITCDTSYLHSWGSIFVQDVLLPLRKEPLTPAAHLKWLRISIFSVAAFAFTFSLFYKPTDYIFMFFNITGAIFVGGSGAVIIGGLYWNRGTTSAAWSAMITGSSLAVGGIIWQQVDRAHAINGTYTWGIAMAAATVVYVTVSLLTCRTPVNMDKLLHRGPYAVADDETKIATPTISIPKWKRILLGYDENFTRGDKFLSSAFFWWSMAWFAAFIVVTGLNVFHRWSERAWWNYGLVGIWLAIILGPITTIWFTWGGMRDLSRLFTRLRTMHRDAADDGTVALSAKASANSELPIATSALSSDPAPEVLEKVTSK